MNRHAKKSKHAFTLVELSIVLVILGLLVGGVLAGQSLIHAAELRSVTTDRTNYDTAFNAFREKYMALPGDFADATRFWTAAHATNATCLTTVRSGGTTCNGDGNGDILPMMGGYWISHENNLAWEHLSLAGLVTGNYIGFDNSTGSDTGVALSVVTGVTTPRSKISSSGWALQSKAVLNQFQGSDMGFWSGRYNHNLVLSNYTTTNGLIGRQLNTGVLTAADAFNVDTKADDGRPGTGQVRTFGGNYLSYCTDTAVTDLTSNATANYYLSATAVACSLMFNMMF